MKKLTELLQAAGAIAISMKGISPKTVNLKFSIPFDKCPFTFPFLPIMMLDGITVEGENVKVDCCFQISDLKHIKE